jgi:nitrite reductase/ring-hydroxylating ferredoxin subunit
MAAPDPARVLLPDVEPPADGQVVRVTADGRPVAIFNRGGELYAIGALCTHVGGPLDKGTVRDRTVECPWHGSRFDLATGAVVQGPARTPVAAYRVSRGSPGLVLEKR